jgi:hypothetical protein
MVAASEKNKLQNPNHKKISNSNLNGSNAVVEFWKLFEIWILAIKI